MGTTVPETLGPPERPSVVAKDASLQSPWLGLKAFSEGEQEYFFGRDGELAELFLRVRACPLTVL